jgi:hypothetical protein
MIRRLDPKYAEWKDPNVDEGDEPEKKQKPKKEKKKKKKGEAPNVVAVVPEESEKLNASKSAPPESSFYDTDESSYESRDVSLSDSEESEEESSVDLDRTENDEIQA